MNTKEHFIKIFRDNGYNCFPIPKYADAVLNQKAADSRYKGAETKLNQPIRDDENYGVIAIKGEGTCFFDFDSKEMFRKFAEENIENGFMVIETPNGWHIPIKGLTGDIKKVMLYEKLPNPEKQIIDVQGFEHYVIGYGSDVYDHKKKKRCSYENKGTEKIWDAKGKHFDDLIEWICKKCNVEPAKHNRNQQYEMRVRFKKGLPPTVGTSNDYWFNAGVVVFSDDLPYEEGLKKVREVFDKWENPTRTWDNIELKVQNAYEGDKLPEKGGRSKQKGEDPAEQIIKKLLAEKEIYSDQRTDEIYENKKGFLENITELLHKEIQLIYPALNQTEFNDIRFKIVGLSPDKPDTDDNLKVFENGTFDVISKKLIITDKIASMGFKDYDYLLPTKDNEPVEFIKCAFENIPDHEHPRLKIALKAALSAKLDSRITIIQGKSRTGKSTLGNIMFKILSKHEEYSMTLELSQLLGDNFHKAEVIDKTLLILSDLPKTYADFDKIKSLTGEESKRERKFHTKPQAFDNKIKIIATANKLAKIPEEEKDAMYSARLSVVHNIREIPYDEDPDFASNIIKNEGEKIISWILNLPDNECKYEDRVTVKKEWESMANPVLWSE